MASLRVPTPRDGGQGIFQILKITSCVTGDTVSWKEGMTGYVVTNRTTNDIATASYSATTQLFTITVANTPDIDLLIMQS
jgi:hypothetical protein